VTIATRPLPARPLPSIAASRLAVPAANATLIGRQQVGSSSALFTIRLDQSLAGYTAGQYVALGVPSDVSLIQRPYSVVSTDLQLRVIELFLRRVEGGALSPRLWQLPSGSRLRVGPPRGLFTLERDGAAHGLFVAAGTGVAPILAMLDAEARAPGGKPTTLVHAVSFADELVFGERITRWRAAGLDLDYRPTVSRPGDPSNARWSGLVGRAEAQLQELVSEPAFDVRASTAYLCGNPVMVDVCSRVLVRAGFSPGSIRSERF
jgi:ferredoxin-NADP reductase